MFRIILLMLIVNTQPSTVYVLRQLKLTERADLFGEGGGTVQ